MEKFGSGMEKSRIRDGKKSDTKKSDPGSGKHPGSATLMAEMDPTHLSECESIFEIL
jgi:hypothetical protein